MAFFIGDGDDVVDERMLDYDPLGKWWSFVIEGKAIGPTHDVSFAVVGKDAAVHLMTTSKKGDAKKAVGGSGRSVAPESQAIGAHGSSTVVGREDTAHLTPNVKAASSQLLGSKFGPSGDAGAAGDCGRGRGRECLLGLQVAPTGPPPSFSRCRINVRQTAPRRKLESATLTTQQRRQVVGAAAQSHQKSRRPARTRVPQPLVERMWQLASCTL